MASKGEMQQPSIGRSEGCPFFDRETGGRRRAAATNNSTMVVCASPISTMPQMA